MDEQELIARAEAAEKKYHDLRDRIEVWLLDSRKLDPWYWQEAIEEVRAALDGEA